MPDKAARTVSPDKPRTTSPDKPSRTVSVTPASERDHRRRDDDNDSFDLVDDEGYEDLSDDVRARRTSFKVRDHYRVVKVFFSMFLLALNVVRSSQIICPTLEFRF